MSLHKNIQLKRVYNAPTPEDGYRILVDRLWPRGLSKESASIDEWLKEIAPTTELRKWYNHQPELFTEFTKRYKQELSVHSDALNHILQLAKKQKVTLCFAAKEVDICNATVLLEVLQKK